MAQKSSFLEKWKKVANKIARGQTYVLMVFIFFLVVPVFSLVRLADPLRLKLNRTLTTYWENRAETDLSLEKMKFLG